MTAMPSLRASSASASPTLTLRSSDSTTQGPAMRNGLLSAANRGGISVGELRELAGDCIVWTQLPMVERGPYESREQRMRAHRPRFQLRMELAADEPGMVGQFDHLDQRAVRRQSRRAQTVLRQHVAVGVRHLVPVAMALAYLRRVVGLRDMRTRTEPAGIGTETHRAAHLLDAFL